MTKVELFEAIRRDANVHQKGIRRIARERGVHRRVVRQALASAIPPERKRPDRDPPVLTKPLRALIDSWLEADRSAPRKQRHTAVRIFRRLKADHAYRGAESTVRGYVGKRRRELGVSTEVFVPLAHDPAEAEVDWFEAEVDFPDGRRTVQLFMMRACFSGREFVMAFPRQTQQAFLEAHVAAFAYFGGVFTNIRYDNLRSAVKRVLRGRRRIETDRFVALRSHYGYDSEFCEPGKRGAHEKGGVEGGLGRYRRQHLVPVPTVEGFSELNRRLLDFCAEDDLRTMEGRATTILEDWTQDRAALRPLPSEPAPTAEVGIARVNTKSCVTVRTNRYSVPVRLSGRSVEYRLHALEIELVHEGRVVARHLRDHGQHGIQLELDHYLELLWIKPGALDRSLPLRQARKKGTWPSSYDVFRDALHVRFAASEATRHMLAVLMLHREYDAVEVQVAVELAIEQGAFDAGAIAVLVRQLHHDERRTDRLRDLGALADFDRPVTSLDDYDQLLTRSAALEVH